MLAITPEIKAGFFNIVINLCARINDPSHTIKFKNKTSLVYAAVTFIWFSTFCSKVEVVRIFIGAAKNNNRIRAAAFPI